MDIARGDVWWADLGDGLGREQSGMRPVVVVSSPDYLDVVDTLVIVVPVTSRDRDWPNHIALSGEIGLGKPSWAMTEQLRTLTRDRLVRRAGSVDAPCLSAIRLYLADFLDL